MIQTYTQLHSYTFTYSHIYTHTHTHTIAIGNKAMAVFHLKMHCTCLIIIQSAWFYRLLYVCHSHEDDIISYHLESCFRPQDQRTEKYLQHQYHTVLPGDSADDVYRPVHWREVECLDSVRPMKYLRLSCKRSTRLNEICFRSLIWQFRHLLISYD